MTHRPRASRPPACKRCPRRIIDRRYVTNISDDRREGFFAHHGFSLESRLLRARRVWRCRQRFSGAASRARALLLADARARHAAAGGDATRRRCVYGRLPLVRANPLRSWSRRHPRFARRGTLAPSPRPAPLTRPPPPPFSRPPQRAGLESRDPGAFNARVLALCRDLLPEWSGVTSARVTPILGGITNQLRLIHPASSAPAALVPSPCSSACSARGRTPSSTAPRRRRRCSSSTLRDSARRASASSPTADSNASCDAADPSRPPKPPSPRPNDASPRNSRASTPRRSSPRGGTPLVTERPRRRPGTSCADGSRGSERRANRTPAQTPPPPRREKQHSEGGCASTTSARTSTSSSAGASSPVRRACIYTTTSSGGTSSSRRTTPRPPPRETTIRDRGTAGRLPGTTRTEEKTRAFARGRRAGTIRTSRARRSPGNPRSRSSTSSTRATARAASTWRTT